MADTRIRLTDLPSELLAEIVELALEPNYIFMTNSADTEAYKIYIDALSTSQRRSRNPLAVGTFFLSKPKAPPMALTCRTLYAECVRLQRNKPFWTFACGYRARVDFDRDIFVVNTTVRDRVDAFKLFHGSRHFWETPARHPKIEDRRMIRHMAVVPTTLYCGAFIAALSKFVGLYENLETLHLVYPYVPTKAWVTWGPTVRKSLLVRKSPRTKGDKPDTRNAPAFKIQALELTPFPRVVESIRNSPLEIARDVQKATLTYKVQRGTPPRESTLVVRSQMMMEQGDEDDETPP
ncbi:hypothetical protein QBC39DRAFT_373342 [Podospora conica]|nr:hypothetical protein QBC39DRAFT_373342 [Schizothecium conicum]